MTTISEHIAGLREIDHDGLDAPWALKDGQIVSAALEDDPVVTDGVEFPEDAEVIVAARNALPLLLDALVAVLDLHERASWWKTNARFCDRCREAWPCATVAAIADAPCHADVLLELAEVSP